MKTFFVHKDSIVRQIWGRADTCLFIFAGAAAEFALNKSVDWLYFTGRLPADPLGRLFSTVTYARQIIFSDEENALHAIDRVSAIHKNVEKNRGDKIPEWAYRDVLFLLIGYSISSFELLHRRLGDAEKNEIFDVFYRVGQRMQLAGLPKTFREWEAMREAHLQENLANSSFTADLYLQYKKHLGQARFVLLKQAQLQLVPATVKKSLPIGGIPWLIPLLWIYKLLRYIKLDGMLKNILLPREYKAQIKALENDFSG
ncbi:MAG: oxygenase MpaB family protein [Sphingobacteriales bacterium]